MRLAVIPKTLDTMKPKEAKHQSNIVPHILWQGLSDFTRKIFDLCTIAYLDSYHALTGLLFNKGISCFLTFLFQQAHVLPSCQPQKQALIADCPFIITSWLHGRVIDSGLNGDRHCWPLASCFSQEQINSGNLAGQARAWTRIV